ARKTMLSGTTGRSNGFFPGFEAKRPREVTKSVSRDGTTSPRGMTNIIPRDEKNGLVRQIFALRLIVDTKYDLTTEHLR
ncbi:hypothetical protein, partial [Bacteroides intestinalis]|uniref:hypothetical protein n=1 Tax=Bacteroides intestinalis TaxID=329854 RepID=UPI003BA9359F